MNNKWKLFILAECLLLIGLVYQIFSAVPLLIAFILGAGLFAWSLKNKFQKKRSNSFWIVLGSLLMIFVLR